ncbi:hypothetical protein T439DRAFT_295970 [Meredithblackwellia eburnea MCA 4105]
MDMISNNLARIHPRQSILRLMIRSKQVRIRPYSTSSRSTNAQSWWRSSFQTLRTKYPNSDPASLLLSFLFLHELTAIIPLGLGFWGLRALGVGDKALQWALEGTEGSFWFKSQLREWIAEGEARAERIGKRYGRFGYERESPDERAERQGQLVGEGVSPAYKATGDVANLAVAYVGVKLLIPARIYLSIRMAPALANLVVQRFQSLRTLGVKYLKK